MFFAKTPTLIQALFPRYTWRLPATEKVLYLTFDDGPIPEITPWVLDMLKKHRARATFFCVGDNVKKHPGVYRQILEEGHAAGNHTFNHLNGWKTGKSAYLDNVEQCAEWVTSGLFRPPYGRLTPAQRRSLQGRYRIIMWDVLSGDYSRSISPEQCLRHVIDHARPGSIVVLHDSLKAERNLRFVLPAVLEHFSGLGYRFEKLTADTGV